MNKELISKIKNEMYKHAVVVNRLVSKYNYLKSKGASSDELNEIAIKANKERSKYDKVEADLSMYVTKFGKFDYASREHSEDENKLHLEFSAFEENLASKYDVELKEEIHEEEHEEEYTHHKPKKGLRKFFGGALILALATMAGYGLSGCSHSAVSETVAEFNTEDEVIDDEIEAPTVRIISDEEEKEEELVDENKEETLEDLETNEEITNEEVTNEETEDEVIDDAVSTNDFAYLKDTSSLYDSKADDKNEIGQIEKFQKVFRINSDGNYDYVQTEDLQYGYIESKNLDVLPDLYVEVDIGNQTVDLYKNNEVILTTLCVTGKDSTPTRIGYFPITYKTYDTYLRGPGYKSHVYYWMPFDGGIGLHDAAWRSEFGGDIHFNSGSHGCVNMPHDAAKEIYENVSTGSKVLVHN